MANLFELAGAGAPTSAGVTSNVLKGVGSMSLPLMFMGPIGQGIGGLLSLGTGLGSIFSGISEAEQRAAAGRRMFGAAQGSYAKNLAQHPELYSTASVENRYNNAENAYRKTIQTSQRDLLDRYSSTQQRLLRNKIQSGLTTGAAQAASVQNNIAFQQQYGKQMSQMAQGLSNLNLQKGQAVDAKLAQVNAQKRLLAQDSLAAQGITDAQALGGLSAKLMGY